jgi:hypothetical protein
MRSIAFEIPHRHRHLPVELAAALGVPKPMYRCLFALSVALAGSAAVAQVVDTLKSADCHHALESLQAREAAVVAARQPDWQSDGRHQRAPDAQLETLRRDAARACLGGSGDAPPPSHRFAQPPIVVPPIAGARLAPPPPLPIGPVGPSPKQVEPPTVVMACDPGGCWASDGSRLNRVGPYLLGPRGLCSVQGTLLHCP